jgi:hypothetical protein
VRETLKIEGRAGSTSSVISVNSVKYRRLKLNNLNFTTEDENEGTMYPEIIPPILLHAS